MGIQLILPVTVPVKKIKGATCQCYGDGDVVTQCEQAFSDSISVSSHHQEWAFYL